MKNARIFTLLLAFSLSITAAVGCSEPVEKVNTDIATSDTAVTEPVETETQRPNFPEADYEGYELRFLSRGNTGGTHWSIIDVAFDEEKIADTINDAIYTRNLYIEETYNVKISQISDSNHLNTAKNSITAGSDDFDIYGDSIASAASLSTNEMLIDLYEIPNVDLYNEWWDQNAREQLSIAGKLYTMVSDFTLLDKNGTWIIMFTKAMIDIYHMDNPYALVQTGEWTLDKMLEMCNMVTADVNGDGVMADDDSFGTVGEAWNANSLMAGAGTTIIQKDEDDLPYFAMNNEHLINAFGKVSAILANKDLTIFTDRMKGSYSDVWTDGFGGMMDDGRALFYITGMNRVTLMRGLDTDFGILPNPKYDTAQENYWHIMSYGNTDAVSIPITNSDIERTGLLLEALTYEASVTSYPAFIDIAIKTKYSRDEESIEMLDIIFSSRVFDLGFIYSWGSAANIYSSNLGSMNIDITSKIAASEKSTIKAIEKTITAYTGG